MNRVGIVTYLTNTLCTVWGFFVLVGMYVVECGEREDGIRDLTAKTVKTLGAKG